MNIILHQDDLNPNILNLLLQADPCEQKIREYFSNSDTFVVYENEELIGVAILSYHKGQYELKNIAVKPEKQGRGIAKQLIQAVKEHAKKIGAERLMAGTGNSSLDQLALYQKCGFRLVGIKPDYFASYEPPIFENGIRCIDMVVLEAEL